MSDKFLLTGTNGVMWDLFKDIIQATSGESTKETLDKIKETAERGIEFLKEESL